MATTQNFKNFVRFRFLKNCRWHCFWEPFSFHKKYKNWQICRFRAELSPLVYTWILPVIIVLCNLFSCKTDINSDLILISIKITNGDTYSNHSFFEHDTTNQKISMLAAACFMTTIRNGCTHTIHIQQNKLMASAACSVKPNNIA